MRPSSLLTRFRSALRLSSSVRMERRWTSRAIIVSRGVSSPLLPSASFTASGSRRMSSMLSMSALSLLQLREQYDLPY